MDVHSKGPDFLCIGAPKCGTTWLHNNLIKHAEIWLPPVKELRYFDRYYGVPSGSYVISESTGVLGLFKDYNRKLIVKTLVRSLLDFSISDFFWLLNYFKSFETNANHDWYKKLFPSEKELIVGEITPAYCALESESVEKIYKSFPALKILFMMRNPTERAWSHAKMMLPRMLKKSLYDITEDEILNYLLDPGVNARGNYIKTICNWETYYKGKILYIFYDDIVINPEVTLTRIFDFLGVSAPSRKVLSQSKKKINESKDERRAEIPYLVQRELNNYYAEDLSALADRFDGWPKHWSQAVYQ